MKDYKNIKITDFSYVLPDEKIAKYPLPERDQSKLLVWENGKITAGTFRDSIHFLPENARLVFNNTRVIHARLFFRKETGAKIEIFCLEPLLPADYQISFQQKKEVVWSCMIGNAKKWKNGILQREIKINGNDISLFAERTEDSTGSSTIRFSWNFPVTFAEIIEHAGILPIPPYLNRETEAADEQTYQTVYAKIDGSVAAPTAGLHFTDSFLHRLKQKNIKTSEITLHVGAGTFQPVKAETIDGHAMHHELVIVSKKNIIELLDKNSPVIAVGTTSVRSLESLYWLGLQMENDTFNPEQPEVKQWEPYETAASISTEKSLENIVRFLDTTNRETIQFSTQIIIVPGYKFRVISGMFTNFHQPKSTLLLLISAFLGKDWKKVYDFALENNYRFLSYGDSNLYLH